MTAARARGPQPSSPSPRERSRATTRPARDVDELRLFVAVPLPDAVRAAVAAAAEPIVASLPGARSTAQENLHVTLRFLGATPSGAVADVCAALRGAAGEVRSARVQVAGFGAFPDLRRPRVVWVGIHDPAGLLAAAERAVSARLGPLGFPREDRPFTAHVTVARIDTRGPHWRRRGPFDALRFPPTGPLGPEVALEEFVLFRSELGRGGAVHRVVERFRLSPP